MNDKGSGVGFELLTRNTDEYGRKGILVVALNKYVLKFINRKRLLDIGSGNGNLTIPLSKLFAKVVIVEPNRKFFEEVRETIGCEGYNKNWEKVKIRKNNFDLILAIHLFYYIDVKRWEEEIQRMLNVLNSGGKIVVALQSKKSRLYTYPNKFLKKESVICSETLMDVLRENKIQFKSFILLTKIWANNIREARILENFLLDAHDVPGNNRPKLMGIWSRKKDKFYTINKEHLIIIDKT